MNFLQVFFTTRGVRLSELLLRFERGFFDHTRRYDVEAVIAVRGARLVADWGSCHRCVVVIVVAGVTEGTLDLPAFRNRKSLWDILGGGVSCFDDFLD